MVEMGGILLFCRRQGARCARRRHRNLRGRM